MKKSRPKQINNLRVLVIVHGVCQDAYKQMLLKQPQSFSHFSRCVSRCI